jgi:flagellar FliL protein
MSQAAEETPKKKGKTLILIIVAANVLLGGGAAAFFVLGQGGGGAAEAEPAAAGHDTADAAAQAAKSGAPISEFPPIIVNLNEPEGTRYLKTTIAIQLSNDKMQAELEQLKPVIKDAFIRDLSELNFRQTMGAKNKSVIKRRLLKRFNEAVGSEAGVEVLFTEFVVQ